MLLLEVYDVCPYWEPAAKFCACTAYVQLICTSLVGCMCVTSVVHVMTHHVIWACAIADLVFVQVAEARQRHQVEQMEIQRENALERRRLAQEERQAAAERVYTTLTALQHGHTPGLFVYKQAAPAYTLLEITALLLRCTAFLLLAAGAAVVLVVVVAAWHCPAKGFVNAVESHSTLGRLGWHQSEALIWSSQASFAASDQPACSRAVP